MPSERLTIPAFSTERLWQRFRFEFELSLHRVLNSANAILGSEVDAFEREWAEYCGATQAIGVASGTDALIVALRALGVGPGDEVLTTANGPVPVISAIRAIDAVPVFVDIDRNSLQMSCDDLIKQITPRCKAVLLIHMYGQTGDVCQVRDVAAEYRLALIEDCSHAHGAMVEVDSGNLKPAGTIGQVGCFSFYPTKVLGALGDAGACITSSAEIAAKLRECARYGFRGHERVAYSDGINSRLDEIQAALLRVRLTSLDIDITRRRSIAERYFEKLQLDNVVLPPADPKRFAVWHQFVIRVDNRDEWLMRLASRGISCGIHYPHPLHRMPAFEKWLRPSSRLQETELACSQVLSLPMFPELTDLEVDRVVEAIQLTSRELL